jgi:hypothetical protein
MKDVIVPKCKGLREMVSCLPLFGGERNVVARRVIIEGPESDQEEFLDDRRVLGRGVIVWQRCPVVVGARFRRGRGRLGWSIDR